MRKLLLLIGLITGVTAVYANEWLSYTVNVNQHKLHYYQAGSGRPIFLLTGYATTSNFWSKPFVNCLAQNHTVYLVDYWGINTDEEVSGNNTIKAMADDSYALSKVLHVKNPVYVGWSMGGAVVEEINFIHDDDLNKVVLISPLTAHNQPQDNPDADDVIIAPLRTYNDILNYVFDNNLYGYNRGQLKSYKHQLFNAKDELFPDNVISNNQSLAMNAWTSDPKTVALAKSSSAKYLFLIPLEDKILNPNKTLTDAKLFRNRSIVKFEGSGHNIAMQAPEQSCKQIIDFIND